MRKMTLKKFLINNKCNFNVKYLIRISWLDVRKRYDRSKHGNDVRNAWRGLTIQLIVIFHFL